MTPDLDIVIRLFIAHIVGDFLLQPKAWIEQRNKRHLKSSKLYIHSAIHALLAAIAVWEDHQLLIFFFIFTTHFLIDLLKSYQNRNETIWFIIDQALHLIILVGLWISLFKIEFDFAGYLSNIKILALTAGVLLLTTPTAVFIGIATKRWRKKIQDGKKKTLKDAGQWIGIIERILIFVFIIFNQFPAVGFLLVAKSIFRFGDLRKAEEKNQTEYLMIGSLLSFGIAIIAGVLVRHMIT